VAGGQSNGTAYLLDGGDNTDAMSNVNLPFPFHDALQVFSVQTSAVSPRFGIHPGATVNVVTKSGSNDFTEISSVSRNSDVNARTSSPPHDSLKRNQYGGTAGGESWESFFGGYQGTRAGQRHAVDHPRCAALKETLVRLPSIVSIRRQGYLYNPDTHAVRQ
jgi:hypothetical protein